MEEANKLKSRNSSEINVCDKTENLEIRSEDVKATIDSDQQTKHIYSEGDDKENLDDPNKMAEVKNVQHAAILEPQPKANSFSLKKNINITRKLHETAARKNRVKFQRKIKFRISYKNRKRFLFGEKPSIANENNLEEEKVSVGSQNHFSQGSVDSESSSEDDKSLQSQDLLFKKPSITDGNDSEKEKVSVGSQKHFSQGNVVYESSCENNKSLQSQNHLRKKPRIDGENNPEKKKDSLGSFVTKPLALNEFQCQSTSSKQSQEMPTKNRCAISAQPVFTLKVNPSATKSHSLKVRSGDDVWKHFKWYLKINEESLNRKLTDGISGVSATTSQCENLNNTGTDRVRTEQQDNFGWEMTEIRDTISIFALKRIEDKRWHILSRASQYENIMKKVVVFSQETEDTEKKVECVSEARKLREMLHSLINYLFEFDIMLQILKEEESNSTSLTKSLSLEPEINTLSSLFLCQYLSLYFEIPIEKIIEKVDFVSYWLVCEQYKIKKEKLKRLREMRRNITETAMCYFISSLDSCRVEMENEIFNLEDPHIEDLRISNEENIHCLNELISTGSLVVATIIRYLNESRRQILSHLLFMDKKRPDIFI